MREINIQSGGAPDDIRALVVGLPSSGKTHFAATCPEPLFISDAAEGGYKTLYEMDPIYWWNPDKVPKVWALENILTDIPKILADLEQRKQAGKFPWRTIIVDPVSIYTDRFIAELQIASPGRDNRQVYGELANHLRALVIRFHALPAHVIWLSHVKNQSGELNNGPAIAGQMGEKFPAYCDFKWMSTVDTAPNKPPTFGLRTQPYRSWTFLGGRWKMPDPLAPSFKCVAEILGLREKPVSPAVPGFRDGCTYAGWIAENKRPNVGPSRPALAAVPPPPPPAAATEPEAPPAAPPAAPPVAPPPPKLGPPPRFTLPPKIAAVRTS